MDAQPPDRIDVRVERTREAVLAAVRELVEREGPHAVTPQRVFAETGVSRSTLHRHWPDSRTLLMDAIAEPDDEGDVPLLGDLRLDIGVDLHQLRLRLSDRRKSAVLVSVLSEAQFDEEFHAVLRHHARAHIERLERVLTAGQAEGVLRPDIDPEDAAALLAGPLFFRRLFLGLDIPPQFVDAVIDGFIAAHSPAPSA